LPAKRVYNSARRRRSTPAHPRNKPVRRRQHVALRGRRREELSRQLTGIATRGVLALILVSLFGFLFLHSDSWLQKKIAAHTPVVEVQAPEALAAVSAQVFIPRRTWVLWIPGVSDTIERRVEKQVSTVERATFEKIFSSNKIIFHLTARRPLARWNAQGIDREGVLFPLAPQGSANVPTLVPFHAKLSPKIGIWLKALSEEPWLWDDLSEIKEDGRGHWTLVLRSGPVFVWGSSDEPVHPKAEALTKILAQAKATHGGMQRADLRFFSEGRIIVSVRRSLH